VWPVCYAKTIADGECTKVTEIIAVDRAAAR
jgi:hypothetical protein